MENELTKSPKAPDDRSKQGSGRSPQANAGGSLLYEDRMEIQNTSPGASQQSLERIQHPSELMIHSSRYKIATKGPKEVEFSTDEHSTSQTKEHSGFSHPNPTPLQKEKSAVSLESSENYTRQTEQNASPETDHNEHLSLPKGSRHGSGHSRSDLRQSIPPLQDIMEKGMSVATTAIKVSSQGKLKHVRNEIGHRITVLGRKISVHDDEKVEVSKDGRSIQHQKENPDGPFIDQDRTQRQKETYPEFAKENVYPASPLPISKTNTNEYLSQPNAEQNNIEIQPMGTVQQTYPIPTAPPVQHTQQATIVPQLITRSGIPKQTRFEMPSAPPQKPNQVAFKDPNQPPASRYPEQDQRPDPKPQGIAIPMQGLVDKGFSVASSAVIASQQSKVHKVRADIGNRFTNMINKVSGKRSDSVDLPMNDTPVDGNGGPPSSPPRVHRYQMYRRSSDDKSYNDLYGREPGFIDMLTGCACCMCWPVGLWAKFLLWLTSFSKSSPDRRMTWCLECLAKELSPFLLMMGVVHYIVIAGIIALLITLA